LGLRRCGPAAETKTNRCQFGARQLGRDDANAICDIHFHTKGAGGLRHDVVGDESFGRKSFGQQARLRTSNRQDGRQGFQTNRLRAEVAHQLMPPI
jgi:hypothetical protein